MPRFMPQHAQQPESVDSRHHDIRDDQIRRAPLNHLERRSAVAGRLDSPALTQKARQIVTHVGVVIDDQESGCGGQRGNSG